jgi:hypothetical protein
MKGQRGIQLGNDRNRKRAFFELLIVVAAATRCVFTTKVCSRDVYDVAAGAFTAPEGVAMLYVLSFLNDAQQAKHMARKINRLTHDMLLYVAMRPAIPL